VVRYDRTIPPGGEGQITLRLKTRGYDGKISKGARVFTNDPKQRTTILTLKAEVKVAIRLSKRVVFLEGQEGQSTSQDVRIMGKLDKPLKIEPEVFNLEDKVTYEIETLEPDKLYRILFTNLPGPRGIYHGYLRLKTNYPERPKITIRIRGKFTPDTETSKGPSGRSGAAPLKSAREAAPHSHVQRAIH
jgi:hypothetical protein